MDLYRTLERRTSDASGVVRGGDVSMSEYRDDDSASLSHRWEEVRDLGAMLLIVFSSSKELCFVAELLSGPPNEKEISHGRVSSQARWTHFEAGTLASSTG
jgi:hypothetical protein